MLARLVSFPASTIRAFSRPLSVSQVAFVKKSKFAFIYQLLVSILSVSEKTVGNTTVVELEDVAEPSRPKVADKSGACVLCRANLPTKVKYTDVLILEQFMREDGTVLPRELTGKVNNLLSLYINNSRFM